MSSDVESALLASQFKYLLDESSRLGSQAKYLCSETERLHCHMQSILDSVRLVLGIGDIRRGGSDQPRGRIQKPPAYEETEQTQDSIGGEDEDDDFSGGRGALAPTPPQELNITIDDVEDDSDYSTRQAAAVLNLTEHTIRIKAKQGHLKAIKVAKGGRGPKQYRFTGAELKRYHSAQ